jgi:hypothetical protein
LATPGFSGFCAGWAWAEHGNNAKEKNKIAADKCLQKLIKMVPS